MAFYQFKKTQKIKADLDEVWEFISSPANLKRITPPAMGFDITSPDLPDRMYEGMIISYRVKPLFNVETTWVTEITQVKNKSFFVDEQRVGPYKLWHHQHHLKQEEDGILMTDIISYEPPFGPLGALANWIIIKRKLEEIFEFRRYALTQVFPVS